MTKEAVSSAGVCEGFSFDPGPLQLKEKISKRNNNFNTKILEGFTTDFHRLTQIKKKIPELKPKTFNLTPV
jgi:hypothetical protein